MGRSPRAPHTDAWSRLLATFRAVHAGVVSKDPGFHLWGSLFDPEQISISGRPGTRDGLADQPRTPLEINNRVRCTC